MHVCTYTHTYTLDHVTAMITAFKSSLNFSYIRQYLANEVLSVKHYCFLTKTELRKVAKKIVESSNKILKILTSDNWYIYINTLTRYNKLEIISIQYKC